MKKRIASLLAALALCLTLLPMAAFAEDAAPDAWDGTADTSWYVGHESDTEYHITTAEQLAGLAQLVNTAPGTTNFNASPLSWRMIWICRAMNGFPLAAALVEPGQSIVFAARSMAMVM